VRRPAAEKAFLQEARAAAAAKGEGFLYPEAEYYLNPDSFTPEEKLRIRRRQMGVFTIADDGRGKAGVGIVVGHPVMSNGDNVAVYSRTAVTIGPGWNRLPADMLIMPNKFNAANGPDAPSQLSHMDAQLRWKTPPEGADPPIRKHLWGAVRAALPAVTEGSVMGAAVGEPQQQLAADGRRGGQKAAAGAGEGAQQPDLQDGMEVEDQQQRPDSPAGSTGSAAGCV
jgi:hypothetical protein